MLYHLYMWRKTPQLWQVLCLFRRSIMLHRIAEVLRHFQSTLIPFLL